MNTFSDVIYHCIKLQHVFKMKQLNTLRSFSYIAIGYYLQIKLPCLSIAIILSWPWIWDVKLYNTLCGHLEN